MELCAQRSKSLYLLGDVFDVWTSDALLVLEEFQQLFQSLRDASSRGLKIVFLPGNRDFNLGQRAAADLGITLGPDEIDVDLEGTVLHLIHGDQLLTQDVSYQCFKRVIRSWPLRWFARSLPRSMALRLARRLRKASVQAIAGKPSARMQIVAEAVRARFADSAGPSALVCGHVHRAERVDFGEGRELLVLPPFYEESRFLFLGAEGIREAGLDGVGREFRPPPGPTRA